MSGVPDVYTLRIRLAGGDFVDLLVHADPPPRILLGEDGRIVGLDYVAADWRSDAVYVDWAAVHSVVRLDAANYSGRSADEKRAARDEKRAVRPPRVQCTGTTRGGAQCRQKTVDPTGLCALHREAQDDNEPVTDEMIVQNFWRYLAEVPSKSLTEATMIPSVGASYEHLINLQTPTMAAKLRNMLAERGKMSE